MEVKGHPGTVHVLDDEKEIQWATTTATCGRR